MVRETRITVVLIIKKSFMEELAVALSGLRKELQCAVCLSVLVNPVSLPCNHFFCKDCVDSVLGMKSAACPLCKQHFTRRNYSADPTVQKIVNRYRDIHDLLMNDLQLPNLSQGLLILSFSVFYTFLFDLI